MYPVQLYLQLNGSFTGYLNDYASPGNEQLRLTMLFNDYSIPQYAIKLKFQLQGQGISIQSKSWYYTGPLFLEPGIPQLASGSDFSGLLNYQNLDFSGITLLQYNQSKSLPEGLYTLKITAYDYQNPIPIQVSNEAILQVWMIHNDPPLLNFPLCGSVVQINNPQQLTFSWMPLNMGGPVSQLGTTYTFQLWEVLPSQMSPGNIVNATAPIYTLSTSLTMISYGIAEPPLIPGRQYVWRVRAQDNEGREYFRNNGYSQICTFTWGQTNALLGNLANITLQAQALSHRMSKCWWDSLSVYSSYILEFRKVNGPGNWFPITTNTRTSFVNNLEPQTQYEARVHGVFPNGDDGPYSNTVLWQTQQAPVYVCGQSTPSPSMQNFQPLTQATIGMIWQAGQFEMHVTQLMSSTSNTGHYSGKGKIEVPYIGTMLNVQFNNILMGSDQVMYQGEVKAMTSGITNWLNQWMSNGMWNANYNYNGTIDSLYMDGNGNIIIISGNDTTIITPDQFPYIIQDASGNVYIVNADGTIQYQNAIPHISLSEAQKNIYREAIRQIRAIHTTAYLNLLNDSMNIAKTDYDNYLRNDLSLTLDTSLLISPDVCISFMEFDSTDVSLSAHPLELKKLDTEFKYVKAQVLKAFTQKDPDETDYDLLANYLFIQGQPSYKYLEEQLLIGTDEEDLIGNVVQSIYRLVENTLNQSMYKKPQQ
ncbi:MAG: hypothetical protein Fur0041_12090 [Bacteroidia bacterium]